MILNMTNEFQSPPTLVEVYMPPELYNEYPKNKLKLSSELEHELEVLESRLDDDIVASVCSAKSDQALSALLENEDIFISYTHSVKIMIFQCKQDEYSIHSIVNVHESGGILIRLHTDADTFTHLQQIFHHPISNIIQHIRPIQRMPISNLFKNAVVKSTNIKIFVTMIDQNPSSYNSTHPHYHHHNVNSMLYNSIQTYLQPFMTKLSPLLNISIITKSPIDFSNDIIQKNVIMQESIESLFHDKRYMQSYYLDSLSPTDYIINYIILLPSLDLTPVHVNNKEIVRYQNSNIFAICNPSCQHNCSVKSLQKQMNKLMLMFMSQIRSQVLGIRQNKPFNHTTYTISYLPIPNGIATHEINSLLQQVIPLKYEHAMNNLEMLNNLFQKRTNIPINTEIGALFQKAIDALYSLQTNNPLSMHQLNHIIDTFVKVKHHPDLLELNHFPREYWLAVFAPLLFPLIVSLFIGLIKEWKTIKGKTKEN